MAMSAVAPGSKKRNDLNLQQKLDVIKASEKRPKPTIRQLAQDFKCGKTQISTILVNKPKIIELYESNASSTMCHTKRMRNSKFGEINDLLYDWYRMATARNLYPDGPLLKEKALQIAKQLNDLSFTASNGWLESWKKKHNIRQVTVSGECGDVRGETVSSWKERIPEIVTGYTPSNIWNLDETGCFWRALPEKGFGEKSKACHGGKKSKNRAMIAFLVNASGQSESLPIVIWKSENPRCFKGVNKAKLPVQYYSQQKAWMTSEIMRDILKTQNRKLKLANRSVILLLDNAGCHPPDVKDCYTNIKVGFPASQHYLKASAFRLGHHKKFQGLL